LYYDLYINMKLSVSDVGSYFIIKLKRIMVILSEKAKGISVLLWPLLTRLLASFGSILKFIGKEIRKQLTLLLQKQNVISDRNASTSDNEGSIGFKQLLRRVGIITYGKLGETIQETRHAIKHDIEVNKQDIESSQSVPLENTIKRSNLNEELAEQIRKQIGLECEVSKVGSLQIEHKGYYSNNFPMSPKITTNRGCILVKGRKFSIIQVIQRN
jgi:hypothetical protein